MNGIQAIRNQLNFKFSILILSLFLTNCTTVKNNNAGAVVGSIQAAGICAGVVASMEAAT